ncbi:protein SAR DEFICIENT 1-like isoform X2 [Trifolium pratense]|uniref:protein SAR DEFICIENT 1-like isoform X2 n=1 Tax=Trifolium pratense TaxID=57577 RepID=UPI001E690AE7|nr:protein SAR DEFICIENT 1-like isoform X2 [Trifolium pratense]
MVSNRKFHQEHKDTGKIPIPNHGSKWNHGVAKQPPISDLRYVINTLRASGNGSIYLENFIRGVVRDVVESKIQERLLSSEKFNEAGKSGARTLELHFINNKLPDTIFTQSNIIAKGEPPLQVALFDVGSKSIVNDGTLSSTKIEICALDGEFGSYGGSEDWTETEFNDNILRERDGKRPLLVGDKIITLEKGVASISKIMFTDNSKWLRGKKFRLGVKAMQNGENIKEGRSQPFRVKDNRGESYQKHYPPYLNDDVWRLEKIAKDGEFHKRLSNHGIHTVKDLLKLLIINESSLHKIFGKIPNKSWLAIIEHAKNCIVDDYKLYSYLANGQQIALIFNAIYKLVGVTNDAQNYYLPETVTPNLQNIVKILKQDAYKNVDNNLEPIDEAKLNSISLAACLKSAAQSDAPVQGLQYTDISTAQGQRETGPCDAQPCTSTSYVNEGMNNCQINVDNSVANIEEILNFLNNVSFDFSDGAECSTRVNFVNSVTDISNNGKPKAVWRKIRAVIKWGISVRKVAAAKRSY